MVLRWITKIATVPGVMLGCNNLGVAYARGQAVPKDPAKAVALYRKACADGLAKDCPHDVLP